MAEMKKSSEAREKLIDSAYKEIFRNGFQAASLSAILKNTNLTKGALYHYFGNKLELGYSVVDERIRPWAEKTWIEPLMGSGDQLGRIIDSINAAKKSLSREELELGCPINNLALEMSPLDEGFRTRIKDIYFQWRKAVSAALAQGQTEGSVRREVDPLEAARFVIAAIAGIRGIAKNIQNAKVLDTGFASLTRYLETLRA